MKKLVIVLIVLMVLITACAAPAEPTQPITSEPSTTTPIPPTATLTSTFTPEPTATETAIPTYTPTPDMRILEATAQELIIQVIDLPSEAYFVVEAYRGKLSNDSIVYYVNSLLGGEMGEIARAYVEESNRTTGYGISYLKTSLAYVSPIRIYHEVTLFEDSQGALNDVTVFRPQLMEELGRVSVENHPIIGDATNVYSAIITEYGNEYQVYLIEFAYRNTAHELAFWGIESEFGLDEIFSIADKLMQKLEGMELFLPTE